VIPGDSENSTIIIVQVPGDHPGQFSEIELDQIREWIDSGAPEN
jgi:predicted transcriptional regulator